MKSKFTFHFKTIFYFAKIFIIILFFKFYKVSLFILSNTHTCTHIQYSISSVKSNEVVPSKSLNRIWFVVLINKHFRCCLLCFDTGRIGQSGENETRRGSENDMQEGGLLVQTEPWRPARGQHPLFVEHVTLAIGPNRSPCSCLSHKCVLCTLL